MPADVSGSLDILKVGEGTARANKCATVIATTAPPSLSVSVGVPGR
jgi:hypothetical protein